MVYSKSLVITLFRNKRYFDNKRNNSINTKIKNFRRFDELKNLRRG